MDAKDIKQVLSSERKITKKEHKEIFGSSGRTSDYIKFKERAEKLEKGDITYYETPVPDCFVSGVRNQVYKLNDDDVDKSEREYKVKSTKEKDGSGNDITDGEGRKLYTFSIRRRDK